MYKNLNPKAYDGDNLIIYNETFDIYNNKLRITGIFGFEFEFNFEKKIEDSVSQIYIEPYNSDNKIIFKVTNFNHQFGASTIIPLPILRLEGDEIIDGLSNVSISLSGRIISEGSSLQQVNITLYVK